MIVKIYLNFYKINYYLKTIIWEVIYKLYQQSNTVYSIQKKYNSHS